MKPYNTVQNSAALLQACSTEASEACAGSLSPLIFERQHPRTVLHCTVLYLWYTWY